MDNMTGFMVPSSVGKDTSSTNLAWYFIRDAPLRFGLYGAICLEYGSTFKDIFKAMAKVLHIKFIVLAKGNHPVMRCE